MSSNKPRVDASHRLLYGFLFLVLTTTVVLIYFANHRPPAAESAMKGFQDLQDVYKKEGLDRFLEEKEKLRANVTHEMLNSRDPEIQNAATNIAVYLFPSELPSEDFERQIGMDDWAPLQNEIENSPGTERSREAFEEMRANIWNYESPSRTAPQLTAQAQQVIRIYKTLSTP